MSTKIGINGFGRVGRGSLRLAWGRTDLQVSHINDLAQPSELAWLLTHDTALGKWDIPVSATDDALIVDGVEIPVTSERDPGQIPWSQAGVDTVLECTGLFRSRTKAAAHLGGSVRRVIISAPGKGEPPDATLVMGVNHTDFDPARHQVISSASCTTNCLAPVAKVLHDNFTIEHGWMTTVHAYTMDQNLLDNLHGKGDLRRGRAAALNIVPTTTGAARAVGLVMPEIAGKLDGLALRVPVPVGSLVDLTVRVERPASKEALLRALETAAEGPMRGILAVSHDPLVSSDIVGDPRPCIVDADTLDILGDRLFKVLAWYDNETGFCQQMNNLAAYMGDAP